MNRPANRILILTALIVLPLLLPGTGLAESRPNIILIMADDLGYGDLSCYGNQEFSTPNLDRLASEGMRFTDFHSSGPVCSPTRAGLMTGRYQQRAGIPGVIMARFDANRHHGLQIEEITLAEQLKSAGYTTAIFGKWHLGYSERFNPLHHGFDHFEGYVSGNIDYKSHFDQVEVFDWWKGLVKSEEPGYTTHLITRNAVSFIEQHQDRPFFLYVAHESPHYPFQGPGDPPIRGPKKTDLDDSLEFKQRAYREMIQEMDLGIGEIINTLERLELSSNTLVFFLSDNGASFGSNGILRGQKGQLWEGGHRVPAIASWPGRIKPGTVCRDTAISLDLAPTIWEIAGTAPPSGHKIDGISLLPLFKGGKIPLKERRLFWNYGDKGAARDGNWKLLINAGGKNKNLLFNLDKDPSERQNLADEYPDKAEMLYQFYIDWKTDVETGATAQPEEPLKRNVVSQ